MLTKLVYVLVYALAIVDMTFTGRALKKVGKYHSRLLRRALFYGSVAIFANILIALAKNALYAEIAYCIYFASIDWVLLYLTGFCLAYTEHERSVKKLKLPTMLIMGIDNLMIVLNPFLKLHFDIYENTSFPDTVFYQTSFNPMYYVHLGIDYIAVAVTVFFIIYRIKRSYDLYRHKYILILSVLMLVVVLNIIYMAFALVLDASVVFYAVAGTLIYFCITRFVPEKLTNTYLGMAVDDMNEGLLLFDINNECIFANSFGKARLGAKAGETTFDSEPIATIMGKLSEKGLNFGKTTLTLPRSDAEGEQYHYQIRCNALRDKKNRILGSYFLIEDDTEEISYLRQLKTARNEADEANRAKSRFLANMSHEIRTPLNAVLGMNELILRESDDPRILEYARDIRTSGTALLSLIGDVLDFSKIEAGREEITNDEYAPYELFAESYRRFRVMAQEKGLELDINYDPGIPVKLIGDRRHIAQVTDNLISNAIKYTESGGVFVSVSFGHSGEDRYKLTVAISDTGIGIDEQDLPRLFDVFQRVNEKKNATIQGTGLGLAITKELVTRMGGTLEVTSAVGIGSTFTFSLKQSVADPTPVGTRRVFAETPGHIVENRLPKDTEPV